MSTEDKAQNAAEKASGSVKETTGKLTGDESLEREGLAEKGKADLKQAAEKAKDALHDLTE